MGRIVTIVFTVLCASGIVAKATNRSVASSGDRHENHYLDVRERIDHLEEKLDSATCKLDKLQTEMSDKLHSFEILLNAKHEILKLEFEKTVLAVEKNVLAVEKSVRLEMTNQMTIQMDRVLSTIILHQTEQQSRAKVDIARNDSESKQQVSVPIPNQNETRTPFCNVNPTFGSQIEQLSKRADVCIRAAAIISDRNLSHDALNPREGSPHEWITVLRRVSGRVNFSRDWDEYKSGFGDLGGEFWLGLEDIYQLTSRGTHRLRVVLTDFSGEVKFAEYSNFYLRGEGNNYRLYVTGYVKGSTAGDGLAIHHGMDFSTNDRDNDNYHSKCANGQRGGWWYNECEDGRLTGQYLPVGDRSDNGISWFQAYRDTRSFKAAEMSIRQT